MPLTVSGSATPGGCISDNEMLMSSEVVMANKACRRSVFEQEQIRGKDEQLTQVTIINQSSHPKERIIHPLTYILATTVMADKARNTHDVASMSYDFSS